MPSLNNGESYAAAPIATNSTPAFEYALPKATASQSAPATHRQPSDGSVRLVIDPGVLAGRELMRKDEAEFGAISTSTRDEVRANWPE